MLFGLIVAIAPGVNDSLLPRAILGIGLDALYFIAFWTSDGRATLGMRLLKLQVGNAFDGRKLELSQAVRRWIALGSWLSAFGYTTVAAGYAGTLLLIWSVVLLATTITSPTKQGLHDRFANSAVVQPVGGGNGIAMACLLILGLLVPAGGDRRPGPHLPGRTGLVDPVRGRHLGRSRRPTTARCRGRRDHR